MPRPLLLLAFLCSGAAGLTYEVVWGRYLALFVGHSAEAAIVVIGTFLGGLSVGALLASRYGSGARHPLLLYALLEVLVAAAGLAFHAAYSLSTTFAYGVLFPALLSPTTVMVVKWTIAGALVLVPSVLMGATFPLMAAGLIRAVPSRSGRALADLYFMNSLGGAAAVLLAGFVLIPRLGLPGTSAGAAFLNLMAAALVVAALRSGHSPVPTTDETARAAPPGPRSWQLTPGLGRVLLLVAGGTAVASFAYEIAWLRMLSLALGSATHAFELMLSAFILGLALGSVSIRRQADRAQNPVLILACVQCLMGALAVATLPAYVAAFGWVADLVAELPRDESGYRAFNVARYGIALMVMLPATLLAGTTLPLITNTLLRSGWGERAIGLAYGINTAGSIAGVALAGLLLLPFAGLRWTLLLGAGLDVSLGVLLLGLLVWQAVSKQPRASGVSWSLAGASAVALAVAAGSRGLDPSVLTSGVYRAGRTQAAPAEMLFYADGRSATIGVHRTADSLYVLTTNGKADASLSARWLRGATGDLPPAPITHQDESTQLLTALVSAAYSTGGTAAVVGHGSGISGHFVLADPRFHEVTTVEIEPRVMDASRAFYPANARVYDDPRSRVSIGDARSYLAHGRHRFNLILSEPSNPWVSGTSSLFTVEFYDRVREKLAEDGVFAQWIQIYETDDDLVTSVLAALHHSFADFHGYLVGGGDLLIVATTAAQLSEPDWSLVESRELRQELSHLSPIEGHHLEGLRTFTRKELSPLLASWPAPNSDYTPVLDVGAERARFMGRGAQGVAALASDPFRIAAALGEWRLGAPGGRGVPIRGMAPLRQRENAFLARSALSDLAHLDTDTLRGVPLLLAQSMVALGSPPAQDGETDWSRWVERFMSLSGVLHSGTAGSQAGRFYDEVEASLNADDPAAVQALVSFERGLAAWDWSSSAEAAEQILGAGSAAGGAEWVPPPELANVSPSHLLDGAVVAGIMSGNRAFAEEAMARLASLSERSSSDFRMRLLRAHLAPGVPQPE